MSKPVRVDNKGRSSSWRGIGSGLLAARASILALRHDVVRQRSHFGRRLLDGLHGNVAAVSLNRGNSSTAQLVREVLRSSR